MTLPVIALYRNPHEYYNVFEIVDLKTNTHYVRLQEEPQCHQTCVEPIHTPFLRETLDAKLEIDSEQFKIIGIQSMTANNKKRRIILYPAREYPLISTEAKQILREYAQTLFPEYDWIENERKANS
jgi:hypothetical protein